MRQLPSAALVLVTVLAASGACSFHSLDYLSEGSGGRAGGNSQGGTGAAPISGSPAGDSGGMAGTVGGTMPAAGTGGGGGTDFPGDGGAAGMPPELPDCTDGAATADETDRDCGGRTCDACAPGKICVTGTDCTSGICTNQVCQPPTCTDLAVNGDETDLNCGGKCPPCELGKHCVASSDCATGKCASGMCQSAMCQDGVLADGCPLLVDNTPYQLSPGHALTSCLDDNMLSVAEGNAMVLWSCQTALQQTFWAVAEENGYFAFRSALSGKCLQVRGASMQEDAVVEQAACEFAPEQLWKPTRIDSSLMQLTNKLSGLALDVAGSNVSTDGQAIVQGKAGGNDTHWHLQRRTSAAYIVISPYADKSLRIRHNGSVVTVTMDRTEGSNWKVLPGLADPHYVSFQSRNEPGRYLRHASFRMWSDTSDGSDQFVKDATFEFATPLVGSDPSTKALQPINYPGRRAQRSNDTVMLQPPPNIDANLATWWITPD